MSYKEQLKKIVPSTLMPFLKASLGKTAVNTVAGINAAVLKDNPHPNRCYSEGFYYESASIVGWDHKFKTIINDQKIKNIDLYCCQAYPNIQIESNYTHYKSVDIVDNVKKILKKKSETKKLTVAVDCTIDYLNSPDVKKILSTFKNEIKNGKLNFIFFHSGQKFDMLGMDNYFGSPFYMINNGDKKWESFNSLLNKDVHKTDDFSSQWFNLSHRYAAHLIDEYRKMIFENTKYILKNVPKSLKPNLKIKQKIRVNTIDNKMQPSFIDIKVSGTDHVEKTKELIWLFYKKCSDNKIKVFKKPSFGFYHPNVTYIPNSSTSTSIRINPGLNPEENAVIIEYLNEIAQMK